MKLIISGLALLLTCTTALAGDYQEGFKNDMLKYLKESRLTCASENTPGQRPIVLINRYISGDILADSMIKNTFFKNGEQKIMEIDPRYFLTITDQGKQTRISMVMTIGFQNKSTMKQVVRKMVILVDRLNSNGDPDLVQKISCF